MDHNPAVTQRYIDEALGRFLTSAGVDRDLKAFAYLRGRRRRGEEPLLSELKIGTVPNDPQAPFDVNLADAEHYMYSRYLTALTGDPSIKVLVTGYQLKKYLDSWRGKEQDMRTNPKFPVLPASMEAVTWGLKGVDDGLAEYKAAHDGKAGSLGSGLKANQDLVYGNYPMSLYKPVASYKPAAAY